MNHEKKTLRRRAWCKASVDAVAVFDFHQTKPLF